jgi:gamma-glutamyl phosphate reductase
MCPSILVKDLEAQKYVAVFTESEELVAFLNEQKANGVDVADKYRIYSFRVKEIVDGEEALDIIQEHGYLNTDSIYE